MVSAVGLRFDGQTLLGGWCLISKIWTFYTLIWGFFEKLRIWKVFVQDNCTRKTDWLVQLSHIFNHFHPHFVVSTCSKFDFCIFLSPSRENTRDDRRWLSVSPPWSTDLYVSLGGVGSLTTRLAEWKDGKGKMATVFFGVEQIISFQPVSFLTRW